MIDFLKCLCTFERHFHHSRLSYSKFSLSHWDISKWPIFLNSPAQWLKKTYEEVQLVTSQKTFLIINNGNAYCMKDHPQIKCPNWNLFCEGLCIFLLKKRKEKTKITKMHTWEKKQAYLFFSLLLLLPEMTCQHHDSELSGDVTCRLLSKDVT